MWNSTANAVVLTETT